MRRIRLIVPLLLVFGATALAAAPARHPATRAQIPPKLVNSAPPPLAPATPSEFSWIAKNNRVFAVALYRQLATRPGNVFISPIGLASAFGPVTAGARGRTQAEIDKTLNFPAVEDDLRRGLGGMLHMLQSRGEGPRVSIANALWLGKGSLIKPAFIDVARRTYDAQVSRLDFSDTKGATAEINSWVARETDGKVPQLFEPGALGGKPAVVLTNAVYFAGGWQRPFKRDYTSNRPFYLADGTTRQVPLMLKVGGSATGERYAETAAVQLLELPYQGDGLSMVVILPKARNGLAELEARLSAAQLDAWLQRIDSSEVRDEVTILLPRVRVESSNELVRPLMALGLKAPFEPTSADFSGISSDRGNPLFITNIVHRTFLRIDEKGTEASAAAGVVFFGERDGPPLTFRADHPFLALIRDRRTGAIMFLGRIAEPT